MASNDHLSPDQFKSVNFSMKQLSRMRSGDFGVPMKHITGAFVGRTHDGTKMTPKQLAESIKTQGVRNPVTAHFGYNGATLQNGHHRYVSGKMAGIKKMPGRVHKEDYEDIVNWKAKYTPPGQDYTWRGYKDKA